MTETQKKAFECAKHLIATYKMISPEHAEVGVNPSTIAGDMIADIQYAMLYVWEYPEADVESVRIWMLNSLKHG